MTEPMPDWVEAVIVYLQGQSSVTALCSTSMIRGEPPQGETPGYAIYVQSAGGFGARPDYPMMDARMNLRCYGPTDAEAARLARLAHATLEGDRKHNGFTAAGCRVLNIALSTAAIDDLSDEDWPLTIMTYELLVSEVPVA